MTLMTQKYDRFKDAPWFQEGVRPPVLIGGAGGIGSWLTVLLNRAGFETYVYDHDSLEAINMAGQLYMHKSIGQTKVDALAEMVKAVCQDDIVANFAMINEDSITNEIVFSAFDNMKARTDMFTTWSMNFKGNSKAIFIDGRLTAEQLTIFCIRGDDEKAINEYIDVHLFPDSDVPDLPCTMAQTSHGAAMIAAHMTEFFTNWYSIILEKDTSRNVPFYWEYMIPIGFMDSREATSEKLNRDSIWVDNGVTEINESTVVTVEHYGKDVGWKFDMNIPAGYKWDEEKQVIVPDTISPEEARERADRIFDTSGIDTDIVQGLPSEDDQVLGDTEDGDLTPQEIAEIDQFLEERIAANTPSDSLNFEEDHNNEALPDTLPNISPSEELPF